MIKTPKKYNKICEECVNECKQFADILLISCRKFVQAPTQMEINFDSPKFKRVKRRKKSNHANHHG